MFQDGSGFKMSPVDVIPECAWYAQIPGNWSLRPREATITSRNFVCLSPFHNFARGKRAGNPWGEALALFKTPSGQPYYFNFHASPRKTKIHGMRNIPATLLFVAPRVWEKPRWK